MDRRIPWIAAGAGAALAAALLVLPLLRRFPGLLPACPFKAFTGLACATCGLTRSALALADGRWAEAFRWHPPAVVLLALVPIAVVWDLQRAIRDRPYPPLPEHWTARLLVAALLFGTWALQALRGM